MAGAVGGNLNQNYAYAYNDENGTLNSMTVSSGNFTDTLNYSYDALQRLTSQTTVRTGLTLAQEYAYKNLSGNRTTTQVSGYTAKVNGTAVDSYTYLYDNLGNITQINRNSDLPVYYTYDAQNQLISILEGDFRYDFTYDTYGNILSVEYVDDYTDEVMSSNTYTYGNPQWVDQLTKFNGVEFEYDQIGNPTKYYNGNNYTFTWNGRELATAVKGSTSVSYKYGADGRRTQKTVGSTVYNYYYADGLLIRQTWGTNYMDFLYDESGSAYSFIYNGTQYYYVKNLQGDVMRIVDTSGNVVANYYYDVWGKVTASGSIGQTNPIRYRGYYYDTDTGFYYLQSRYYDPAVKRFISADGAISGVGGEILGYNQYAYCFNNPINMTDESGNWAKWLETTVKVLSVTVAVAATVTMVAAVSAFTAGTGSAAAVYGASIFLGATLSGINGGIANEAKGNSYANGYLGGITGGTIQSVCSKTPLGVIVGGTIGVTIGTAITDGMNNLDPYSQNSTAQEIAMNAISSGGKALITSSITAFMGYASDLAVIDGANGLMPTYTYGFGEAVKTFFGWLDDALVYIFGGN